MTTMNRIIYPTPEGGGAVIIPTGDLSIEEVAAKDVPEGTPYEIVEDSAIPTGDLSIKEESIIP